MKTFSLIFNTKLEFPGQDGKLVSKQNHLPFNESNGVSIYYESKITFSRI